MAELVHYESHDGVALASLSNPPVNALSASVRQALLAALDEALADPEVSLLVLSGSGSCFCAGLDLSEVGAPGQDVPPLLGDLIERIESADKPVVAAVHGAALAAGFELALGCHYRVATADAYVGLPQVKLGLMPAAGGTQRLPRVLDFEAALDVILSGEPITADDALALGIFDRLAPQPGLEAAVATATLHVRETPGRLPRIRDADVKLAGGVDPGQVAAAARRRIERRARGLIAPWACIDSVYNAAIMNFDQGLDAERSLYVECRDTAQSRAQRHLLFAERQASRTVEAASRDAAASLHSIGLVGCGVLGAGIAIACANAGLRVEVLEASADALERGVAAVRAHFETGVARGRLTRDEAQARLKFVRPAVDYEELRNVDLV